MRQTHNMMSACTHLSNVYVAPMVAALFLIAVLLLMIIIIITLMTQVTGMTLG